MKMRIPLRVELVTPPHPQNRPLRSVRGFSHDPSSPSTDAFFSIIFPLFPFVRV